MSGADARCRPGNSGAGFCAWSKVHVAVTDGDLFMQGITATRASGDAQRVATPNLELVGVIVVVVIVIGEPAPLKQPRHPVTTTRATEDVEPERPAAPNLDPFVLGVAQPL